MATPVALAGPQKSRQLTEDGALPAAPPTKQAAARERGVGQRLAQRQDNLELVGSFRVPGVRPGQIADVAMHKGFAYLNSWDDPNCQGGGTYVVDIRDPSDPKQVAFIPAPANYYHGEGAHVVSVKVPGFEGDILAVNDETYGSNLTLNSQCAPTNKTGGGFDLYNVTDPAHPVALVQGAGDRDHDNDPATPARSFANSYHSVFVWQDGPRAYLVASDNVENSDVDIFDITDPAHPVMVGDHDLVALFPQIVAGEHAHGGTILHHDMIVKRIDGKPIMMSDYWDAGYVQLDVSDPAHPVYVNDTRYAGEDPLLPGSGITPEGNAHQGEFSFDNQFLLAADEDFSPFRGTVSVLTGSGAGNYPGAESGNTNAPIFGLPGRKLNGPTTYVGKACAADTVDPPPSTPLPAGEEYIALIERGPDDCLFKDKIAKVAAAGWDGYLVFNQVRPDDTLVNMSTEATIPGLHMRRVDALRGLFDGATSTPAVGTAGEDFEVKIEFDGWGYAHLYDRKTGDLLDSYAIPEAREESYAFNFGTLSIHEFATDPTENLAYSSYYAGGIRVLRFSRAAGLEPMGAWIAPGGSNFWGVEQFTAADGTRLIAGSDRDFGLRILRYTGPGAPAPPSCSDGSARTSAGAPVRLALTCADANGNPLSRRIVQAPAGGTLGGVQDDAVLYTPKAGFSGADAVRFVANDGAADSQPATMSVTVDAAAAVKPSNKLSRIKIGTYKNGRVLITLTAPGPGSLGATMRANLPRAKASAAKLRLLARASKRVTRAGRVRVVLKLSKAKQRQLRRTLSGKRKRLKATIRIAFKPIGGTTGTARRTLLIRRSQTRR